MAERSIKKKESEEIKQHIKLVWLKASYSFHTYAYRDPRSVFASAIGCPVVSPTTVLLGIASTLFRLGYDQAAKKFLDNAGLFSVIIDSPNGVIFFRAFHQLRRYETDKYDKTNPRLGLTKINQGTREYGLVDGTMSIFIGISAQFREYAKLALTNLTHLGTHDSLCSLQGDVSDIMGPPNVLFFSGDELPKEQIVDLLKKYGSLTIVSLSRFIQSQIINAASFIEDTEANKIGYWWIAGGKETEIIPYVIPGKFIGTTRGKLYLKMK